MAGNGPFIYWWQLHVWFSETFLWGPRESLRDAQESLSSEWTQGQDCVFVWFLLQKFSSCFRTLVLFIGTPIITTTKVHLKIWKSMIWPLWRTESIVLFRTGIQLMFSWIKSVYTTGSFSNVHHLAGLSQLQLWMLILTAENNSELIILFKPFLMEVCSVAWHIIVLKEKTITMKGCRSGLQQWLDRWHGPSVPSRTLPRASHSLCQLVYIPHCILVPSLPDRLMRPSDLLPSLQGPVLVPAC